jgi:hypothetical protein
MNAGIRKDECISSVQPAITQPNQPNVISSVTALFLECIGENIIIPSTEFVDAACLKSWQK